MRASPALACALLLAACDGGDGQSCVLDTDCTSFAEVCIEGLCQPVGVVPEGGLPDSGPGVDAGPGMDAGPGVDSGPGDAGPAADAGPPMEAGPMMCPDVSGTWGISGIVTACGSAVVGETVTVANDPAGSCAFTVTPDGADASLSLVGSFTLDDAGELNGPIDAGALGEQICTGNVMGGNAITLVCGGCVMNLSLM